MYCTFHNTVLEYITNTLPNSKCSIGFCGFVRKVLFFFSVMVTFRNRLAEKKGLTVAKTSKTKNLIGQGKLLGLTMKRS